MATNDDECDGTLDHEERAQRDERNARIVRRRVRRDATRTPDTGRYQGGYRIYRDGSYREDFGSDR